MVLAENPRTYLSRLDTRAMVEGAEVAEPPTNPAPTGGGTVAYVIQDTGREVFYLTLVVVLALILIFLYMYWEKSRQDDRYHSSQMNLG
jgi:hypothetical protein